MENLQLTIDQLIDVFSRWSIRTSAECKMQSDVEQVLQVECIEFDREVELSRRDRIDFLVGRIGIECKVKGGADTVLAQLYRYAESSMLDSILLFTSKRKHRSLDGSVILGKVVRVVIATDL